MIFVRALVPGLAIIPSLVACTDDARLDELAPPRALCEQRCEVTKTVLASATTAPRFRAVATATSVGVVIEHESTVELRILQPNGEVAPGSQSYEFSGRAPNIAWNGFRFGLTYLSADRTRIEFNAIDPLNGIVRRDRYAALLTARDEPTELSGSENDGTFHTAWRLDEISRELLVYQHVSPDGHPMRASQTIEHWFSPIGITERGPLIDASLVTTDRRLLIAVVIGTPVGPLERPSGVLLEPVMVSGRMQFAYNGSDVGVIAVTAEVARTDDPPEKLEPVTISRFVVMNINGSPKGVVLLDQPTHDIALTAKQFEYGVVVRPVLGDNAGKLVFDRLNPEGPIDAAPECVSDQPGEGPITLVATQDSYMALLIESEGDQKNLVAISGFGCQVQ